MTDVKQILALALLAASAAAGAAPASHPSAWVLAYAGKSTNSFIWDKRARALVQSRVPAALARDVLAGLGGPPGPVLVEAGRYMAASACVHHYCPDKGFFWIDSRTGAGLGAYFAEAGSVLRLGSNAVDAQRIPAPAQQALVAWLGEYGLRPETVSFVSRSGRATPLPPAPFVPRSYFQAPRGGPSFDCGKAATSVEQAICADAALSRQDLELARLVREVRHGHATLDARAELLALQRRWLRERDARCGQPAGQAACIGAQYRAQHERISNWVPSGAARQPVNTPKNDPMHM